MLITNNFNTPPQSYGGRSQYSDRGSSQQPNRIFIANLNYIVSDEDLRALFEPYGEVIESFHVNDKFDPSRKRGFGFVTMDTMESCNKAVNRVNRNIDRDKIHKKENKKK
jgi:RNA recognition motif-containing protein